MAYSSVILAKALGVLDGLPPGTGQPTVKRLLLGTSPLALSTQCCVLRTQFEVRGCFTARQRFAGNRSRIAKSEL